MWFSTSPVSNCTATRANCGSNVSPLGSLMISAPSSSAFCATPDLYVSTEIGADSLSRRRFSTGTTRRSSSASEIRLDPGRVDSAPTSMMSAPCSSISIARAKARSGSWYLPPSENESGVIFNTPMISVRSPSAMSRFLSFHR